MVSPEEKCVSSGPEAVRYFLRKYSQSSRISSAITNLRAVFQGPMQTERELKTRLYEAICRCRNVHPPEKVRTLYINALDPTTCPVVAGYRKFHHRFTYLDVVDFAQHEGDAVRAQTVTPQSNNFRKPLQKLQTAAIL